MPGCPASKPSTGLHKTDYDGSVFLKLTTEQAVELLSKLASSEDHPETAAERFFPLLKQQVDIGVLPFASGRASLGVQGRYRHP